MTLKLHRVECRAIVGHYEGDKLVGEEASQALQAIFQPEQFADFWRELEAEVGQRNEAEPTPQNRKQRRARQPRKQR
jgi:hypothetical protein